ncbi:DUF357 domain-containing protein [Candidatus Woesearchaeota archaeon]|nr:DUF357 domain-containing protein [Candidatus Woesearchaeota archaeon]
MDASIPPKRLEHYFALTKEALAMAKKAPKAKNREEDAAIILDMAQRYYDDALHFHKKGEEVNAFACLNYAHGWLDCGARLGVYQVKDSKLFTVDDE